MQRPSSRSLVAVAVTVIAAVAAVTYVGTSNAGPLEPPAGPVTETSPSLADLAQLIQASGSGGVQPIWEPVSFLQGASPPVVSGDGVIRRIIVTADATPSTYIIVDGDGREVAFSTKADETTVIDANAGFTGGLTVTLSNNNRTLLLLIERPAGASSPAAD